MPPKVTRKTKSDKVGEINTILDLLSEFDQIVFVEIENVNSR